MVLFNILLFGNKQKGDAVKEIKDIWYFEISDISKAAELVKTLKLYFWKVNGTIFAPGNDTLFSRDSGFLMRESEIRGLEAIVVGRFDSRTCSRLLPETDLIILGKKLPGFVGFEDVGVAALIKNTIAGLLQKKYKGDFSFRRQGPSENIYNNAAQIAFKMNNAGYIQISWEEKYGGRYDYIDSVVRTCKSLGFAECEPVKN